MSVPVVADASGATVTGAPSKATINDYVQLTKPRIITLLVITAYASMLMAGGTDLPLGLLVAVLGGGSLAAGAAGAFNSYVDRDIDPLMKRTSKRPLAQGTVPPSHALVVGGVLTVVSFAVILVMANLLAAALAMFAIVFYIFVYTMWLKRRTAQNIVIGGLAGAVPPLVGWAAVTGTVGLPAFVLAAIIFLWTPPHFWALALVRKADYGAVGIPMLPNVAGDRATRIQITAYSVVLAIATLALWIPLGAVGPVYGIGASLLGLLFVAYAVRLQFAPSDKHAMSLFWYSIFYLSLVFSLLVVDRITAGMF